MISVNLIFLLYSAKICLSLHFMMIVYFEKIPSDKLAGVQKTRKYWVSYCMKYSWNDLWIKYSHLKYDLYWPTDKQSPWIDKLLFYNKCTIPDTAGSQDNQSNQLHLLHSNSNTTAYHHVQKPVRSHANRTLLESFENFESILYPPFYVTLTTNSTMVLCGSTRLFKFTRQIWQMQGSRKTNDRKWFHKIRAQWCNIFFYLIIQ